MAFPFLSPPRSFSIVSPLGVYLYPVPPPPLFSVYGVFGLGGGVFFAIFVSGCFAVAILETWAWLGIWCPK